MAISTDNIQSHGAKAKRGSNSDIVVFNCTGRHVFACDSQAHLNQWVEAIRDAVSRDRVKMRKAKSKSAAYRDGEEIDVPLSGTVQSLSGYQSN